MIKIFEQFNKPRVREEYYDNGQKKVELWFLNDDPRRQPLIGKFHRKDGPSYQEWFANGQKRYERWHLNNKLHRKDGPAQQGWFDNGQKWYKHWLLNGKSHKEDGPAYQQWFENGQKRYEIWWLNDIKYSREEWVEELDKIGSKYYKEQLLLLNMEKYNL